MLRKCILITMLLAVTWTLTAWAKARFGEAVPGNIEVVKLKGILENPEKYKDKEVVLEGNYGNYCCASDFVYKEGVDAVEVYPTGFPTPKLDRGKPIRIYGIVRSIEKKAGYEEKTENREEKEEEHHEVYIEAKGVEVK